jgi:hypothetical protein
VRESLDQGVLVRVGIKINHCYHAAYLGVNVILKEILAILKKR